MAREGKQRRPHEEQTPDERRDGIPGETEDEGRAATAERERLSGPHRDAPEHLLDAEPRLDATDEIVWADGDAPRRHDDVRLERPGERGRVRLLGVLGGRKP